MTISTTAPRAVFNCDGATKVFPVPIQAYQPTDFLVIHTTAAGGQAVFVLNSDYSLATSGSLNPTAWTMTTLAAAAWPAGDTLQVILNPVQQQQTQYVQGQAFPSLAVQTNVDRLTEMVQRLQDQINRSIIAPDGDVLPSMGLPSASARKNTQLMFDANGNVALGTPTNQVISIATLAPYLNLGITAGETAAGAVIVNQAYPPYHIYRYITNAVPGTTDLRNAIQVAMNAALNDGGCTVLLPPGILYCSAGLTCSPDISIKALGRCYLTTALAAGNFLSVSNQYGATTDPYPAGAFGNPWFIDGPLFLINTTLQAGNTATAIFWGGDATHPTAGAINMNVRGLSIAGFQYGESYGYNAYTYNYVGCTWARNRYHKYLLTGYTTQLEKMTHAGCIFGGTSTGVVETVIGLAGTTIPYIEMRFQSCSFDYNLTILPAVANLGVFSFTGCHFESNSTTAFLNPVGVGSAQPCSIQIESTLVLNQAVMTNAVLALMGAFSTIDAGGIDLNTGAYPIFVVNAATANLVARPYLSNRTGAGLTYISNPGFGAVNAGYQFATVTSFGPIAKAAGIAAAVDIFTFGSFGGCSQGMLQVSSDSAGKDQCEIFPITIYGQGVAVAHTPLSTATAGAGSTFTLTETQGSPVGGTNKLTLTNTSGAACTFTYTLTLFYNTAVVTQL